MSFRGKNPSRPSNTGFKVVPAHAPHSAYLGKAKKLKESLIERAKIKKSFAKALKREGLQSERLGRGSDGHITGPGPGSGSGLGSGGRGRGSGRGASTSSRGTGRKTQGVMAKDGVRELVQLSRQSKPGGVSKPAAVESESDESELESGEERAPKPNSRVAAGAGENDDETDDDGFFDDADDADMIDSKVSLGRKGKGRAGPSDEGAEQETGRSRERSRAGPAPGSDNDDADEEVFLPYTAQRGRGQALSRGRGGPSTRGSTSGRGRGSASASASTSASSSTAVYGAGTPRPWGTNGLATMTTTTRPKGKKDAGNPNFTFLGRDSNDGASRANSSTERGGRAPGGSGSRQRESWKDREVPREVIPVINEPYRGKPLHTHTSTTSTPTPKASTASLTANPDRSLRDLKRTAYLGPAKSSSVVHPGRTNRELQKQHKEQQQRQQGQGQPGGQGQRRGSQPRLGARMGALLQEIERRAT